MAKSNKAYKAEIAGEGLHRIDGIVREVNDAGVIIDIKERGRRTMKPTLIPMKDIVAHTGEGAGFVVAHGNHALEPISGKVVAETADEVVIEDADGTQIHFPLDGRLGARFVSIDEDDRSLNKGAVESKVARLADRETGSGGKKGKKGKKGGKDKGSDDAGDKKGKKKKAGLRRKAG